ncbi:CDP-alcohol phosphatidyltransferase family protein [Poseidonocella sp. HB161398]|uniref:CDP-alcohol phosphatidyltransferase family protein n=1 Tax=Poseidonocella sp. HB161398 TaxID=2320855 RepID=UPI001109D0B9|nr:CDP-alcohol phosphatidyltransferase family protein [Poseidonocella sp. HB161398]
MYSPDPSPSRITGGPSAMLALLSALYALGLCAVSALLAGEWVLLPAAGFALAAAICGHFLRLGWQAPRLGPANALTLARLALAMLLLLPLTRPDLSEGGTGWAIFGLAAAALALDGADGAAARRSGLAGPWGARFDMEADALFGLLLAAVAWRTGAAGAWILLLGGMRYLFAAAALALPWLAAPLPQRLRRKAVCVLQLGTLVALLAPAAAPPWSDAAAAVALALLAWSFAADILLLARRR